MAAHFFATRASFVTGVTHRTVQPCIENVVEPWWTVLAPPGSSWGSEHRMMWNTRTRARFSNDREGVLTLASSRTDLPSDTELLLIKVALRQSSDYRMHGYRLSGRIT